MEDGQLIGQGGVMADDEISRQNLLLGWRSLIGVGTSAVGWCGCDTRDSRR